jgi:hypothetical protein
MKGGKSMFNITALLEVLKEDNEGLDKGTFAGAIPLNEAILCVDCETITQRIPEGHCGHCGSDSVLQLAVALQGPKDFELPPSGIELAFRDARSDSGGAKLPKPVTGPVN